MFDEMRRSTRVLPGVTGRRGSAKQGIDVVMSTKRRRFTRENEAVWVESIWSASCSSLTIRSQILCGSRIKPTIKWAQIVIGHYGLNKRFVVH